MNRRLRPQTVPATSRFIVSVLLAYFCTMLVSRLFFRVETWNLAMIWPAAGVSVLALLRVRDRKRWLVIACLALANVSANLATGSPVQASIGYAAANLLESLLAAELILKLTRADVAQLSVARDLVSVVFASCAGAAVGGLIGQAFSTHPTGVYLFDVWWHWTRSHSLGMLLVVVAVLPWADARSGRRQRHRWYRLEFSGFVLVLATILYGLFGHSLERTHVLPYAVLPILMWPACRMPLRYTTSSGLMVAVATIIGTKTGHGLFASLPYVPATRIAEAQIFAAISLLTSTLVGLAFAERECAQERARTEEEAYRNLIETAEEGIWTIDAEGKITFVNAKLTEMLGYSAEEMLGQPPQVFMDAQSAAVFQKDISARADRVRRERMEWRYRRKDGTPLWAWLSLSPILGKEGQRVGDVAMLSDITERKLADEERESTIEFLRLVSAISGTRELIEAVTTYFQQRSGCEAVGVRLQKGEDYPYFEARGFPSQFVQAEDSLCCRGQEGKALQNSNGHPTLECMCGNVILGRFDPSQSFFTAGGSFWTNSTTQLLATTTEANRQSRTRNRCNGEGYESVALIPLCLGEQRFGLLQLNDRRPGMFSEWEIFSWERLASHLAVALAKCRAEEALRRSEASFRSLVQNAPYGICRSTLDGKLTSVNPRLVDLLGYGSEQDLLGVNIAETIYSDPREGAQLIEAIEREGDVQGSVLWKRKDGREITVRLSARFLPGESHFEAMAEDISQTLELERQLRQSQKLEAVGSLAGGIAHDFNNLLMIIDAHSEMMLQQLAADDPLRVRLGKVSHAAKRGAELTRQLLAFSRKQVLNPSVLNLNSVLLDLRSMVTPLIGEGIVVELHCSPNLWQVRADPGQIEQVVVNLAVNARDAMTAGGVLILGTRNVRLDAKFVQNNKGAHAGEYVELFIADTGCGMTPDVQARIFDPFFTTKVANKGTGLGLSTVYGIVKQSGGYIAVQSQVGAGSTFHIYLPRTNEPVQATDSARRSAATTLAQASILVVEDEEATRDAICAYLQQRGFDVRSAPNATDALAACAAAKHFPDVILTDVVLPGLSGPELVDQLRRSHAQVKVIFMSGYANDQIREHTLAQADVKFLAKPFVLPDLVSHIEALLR